MVVSIVTIIDLHSTMYLLKLIFFYILATDPCHLHSTMYLLKPCKDGIIAVLPSLHSTMYLLKRSIERTKGCENIIYIPLCIY